VQLTYRRDGEREEKMEKFINEIHVLLNERGITTSKHRIEIIETKKLGKSNGDWAAITVNITPPRKRKATLSWTLVINFVRKAIDWEQSSFSWL